MNNKRRQIHLFLTALVLVAGVFIVSQLNRFGNDASLSDWHQGIAGYIQAVRDQSRSGAPMALFFYTDWCPNCRKLREQVLSSEEVRGYLANLQRVRINPENGPAEDRLAREFGVVAYPSFFIVDAASGEARLIRRTSNITPAQFIEQLREAANQG